MNYTYTDELYHHGIKGQKWGVKNGPPYPLDEEQKSTKEKKMDNDRQTNVGRYVKIGAAIAITGLAAYGAYKYGPELLKRSANTGFVGDLSLVDPSGFLDSGDISGDLKEAIKSINSSGEPDHCQQNAVVACLKYMGATNIDTKAGAWSTATGSIVDKVFKGDISKKVKEPNLVFDTADKASDWIIRRLKPVEGSCGTISCDLVGNGGNGHAIMWVYENNKVRYADPWARTPNGHRVIEDASLYFGAVFSGEHPCISRIDNLEINEEEFYNYFEKIK